MAEILQIGSQAIREALQKIETAAGNVSMSQNNEACEYCQSPFEKKIAKFPIGNNREYTVPTCECYENKRIEEENKRIYEDKIKLVQSYIPERYKNSNFITYTCKTREQSSAINKLTGGSWDHSFFICGSYGSGKTHLIYAQFRDVSLKTKRSCYIRSTKELIQELQDDEMDKKESSILYNLHRTGKIHLFWDDADKFKATDFKLESLFDLVDRIYRGMHFLTITSNSNLAELQEKLSPAIIRRIDDICTKIEL